MLLMVSHFYPGRPDFGLVIQKHWYSSLPTECTQKLATWNEI